MHVLVGNGINQSRHLVADSAHQLVDIVVVDALDVQLVLDQTRQLRIGHSQLVLQVRLHDGLLEELLQGVVQRAIDQGRSSGQSLLFTPRLETNLRRVLELLEVD